MTFEQYINGCMETAFYPKDQVNTYLRLGLRGEAGEVCDKVKKLMRDKSWNPGEPINTTDQIAIALELGDVLWYAAMLSHDTGEPMVYEMNSNNWRLSELNTCHLNANTKRLPSAAIDLSDAVCESSVKWIVSCIEEAANAFGYGLDQVAMMNLDKLHSRLLRDKINGSGDYR